MIQKVKKTMNIYNDLDDEKLCPILENYKIGEYCDTIFKYDLNNEGIETATIGIKDLELTLDLIMTFTPSICSIKIVNNINGEIKLIKKKKKYRKVKT